MASLYKAPGVHIESAGDRYIPLDRVETGVCAFLGVTAKGPKNEPVRISSYEGYVKNFGDDDSHMASGVRGFFDNGGTSAVILNITPESGLDPVPDDYIGNQGGGERGLRALERVDDVDLVVAPDLVSQYGKSVGFPEEGHVMAVQRAIVDHCERMHDRLAILDSIGGHTVDEVTAWRNRFDSSHAALYYPWIKVRVGEKVGPPIPPSGHIAGLFAQADKREGVHRAAANLKLEGLVDIERKLKKRERDHLFDKNINTLVPFPGRGLRTWGARTLSSDQAFKQINVRRLFILLRKSIERYAQWVVFEPNEESLWKRLTRTISIFLRDMWVQGALVGASEEEAFYVKCDEETNPPEARDIGQLVCEIGVSPVKPAEYIIVRIHQFTRERTDADKEEKKEEAAAAG
ncbi:MAG: phage tail sheath family protein [Deltaproteobacteria bacterium]|nr:phage tail sheath family protein [Deltaproteobacteria bacterium]